MHIYVDTVSYPVSIMRNHRYYNEIRQDHLLQRFPLNDLMILCLFDIFPVFPYTAFHQEDVRCFADYRKTEGEE